MQGRDVLKKRENGNYEMRVLAGAAGKIAEEIVTYLSVQIFSTSFLSAFFAII